MRLAEFINNNMEQILAEWEGRAAAILYEQNIRPRLALHGHVGSILRAIATDIERSGLPGAAAANSVLPGAETASATKAALREFAGFKLRQLGLEYRALRAAVVALWYAKGSPIHETAVDEMLLFHELMDHSLAEYISCYSEEATRTRDAFLSVLGHDLRSPLSAISMAGDYLSMPGVPEGKQQQVAAGIKNSAAAMNSMIRNLLAYARTRLGKKMTIAPELSDMGSICQAAVEEARRLHPQYPFQAEFKGDLYCEVDPLHLQQVLLNLLNGAVQQGTAGRAITLMACGGRETVSLRVETRGDAVALDMLQIMVNPLVQVPFDAADIDSALSGGVGLGLFTAREIVLAHGGTIGVSGTEDGGTMFFVDLPRRQSGPKQLTLEQRRWRYG